MSILAIKRPAPRESEQHDLKRVKIDPDQEFQRLDPRLCPALVATNAPASTLESYSQEGDDDTVSGSQPSTPAAAYPCREKKFECDFPGCGKAYNRPVRLAEHQRSHTNERPFVCERDRCGKSFLRDSHLKHHVKAQHENVRDWLCDWPGCGQAFATGTRMRTHRKRHEGREQFRCTGYPPCEQQFRKAETLQRHVAGVHLKDAPYVCEHVDQESGESCGRRFKQCSGLAQHREREHEATKPKYFCNECGSHADEDDMPADLRTGYSSYGELQAHIKDVHPPTCNLCGQICTTSSQLKAHMDIEHVDLEERRTISCQEPRCSRKFTKKGNMLVHYRSAHKEQKFICGQFAVGGSKIVPEWDGVGACGRGFVTKASLEKHVRTQHLNLPLQISKGREKRQQRKARMAEHEHEHELEHESRLDPQQATDIGDDAGVEHETMLMEIDHEAVGLLPCAITVCQQRFQHMEELEEHLESVHGFSSLAALDSAEAVCEKEALSGGRFWVGGNEGSAHHEEDRELADRLTLALGGGDDAMSLS